MVKNKYFLLSLCTLFIFIKLIAISTTNFNLYGDEAQYWLWSKNLSFGYYSKPPLFPWLIRLVGLVTGNTFVALKLIPLTLYCITSYLIYIFAKKLWADKLLAYYCAVTFFLLPSVSLSSFLLSTDILLIFLWTWGLIQLLNIKESPSAFNFICLGIIMGAAFLTKYAAIYFIISLIVFILVEKSFKIIFFQSKLNIFLCFVSLIIILLPNIIWNYQNSWTTFKHTAENASLYNLVVNFKGLFEFLLSQIIMIGPILFICFVYSFKKNIKITANEKLLFSFSLPALLIVLMESFLVRAHANWAAVSLVSLSVLFVSVIYKFSQKIIHINNYFNLAVGVILFVLIGISFPLSVFDRIRGVEDFVKFLDNKNRNEIDVVVVSDRLLFAVLSKKYFLSDKNFYSPYKPGTKIGHHFQLKNALPNNFSQSFILIGNKNEINYLNKKSIIKKIGNKSFPFSKESLEIYEITFD